MHPPGAVRSRALSSCEIPEMATPVWLRKLNSSVENSGLCRCGCGGKTKVAPRTHTSRGWVKGQPQPYLRGHSTWKSKGPQWVANESGCWIWQRHFNNQGYGSGSFGRLGYTGQQLAHRVLYAQRYGPIPDTVVLDHRCHSEDSSCPGGLDCPHRQCVNPEHLEPVTQLENVHRATCTKISDYEIRVVYEMRLNGKSWRKIAAEFGMTHAPLITRVRAWCERNGLPYQ